MSNEIDSDLRQRLDLLSAEGWDLWSTFDMEVRQENWHPFVAADYELVLQALIAHRSSHVRFLEWGSATGVITIMADLLGYEAYGIELDSDLVRVARDLAQRHNSKARFALGSFLPSGYRWEDTDTGDSRLGTIGEGNSGYAELDRPLEDFDLVFGFPWDGENAMMLDLMRAYGNADACLLIHSVSHGVQAFRGGQLQT